MQLKLPLPTVEPKLPLAEVDAPLEGDFRPSLPAALDAAALNDWLNCPSLFYLRHVLGLRRRDYAENANLAWGSAWHQLMYAWNRTQSVEAALAVLDPWPPILSLEDPHGRTRERIEQVFAAYLKTFEETDKELEVLQPEHFFDLYCPAHNPSCPFGGCDLRWSGRLDREVVRRGRVIGWDYKTTSYLGRDYFERYKCGVQLKGYAWALAHLNLDAQTPAIVLDVVHTLKGAEHFYRRTLQYTLYEIAEWVRLVRAELARIEETFEKFSNRPERWPKNWNECFRWGSPCQFAPVHLTPPIEDTRSRILASDYVLERWDPSSFEHT